MKSDDVERIKREAEALTQASHKLAEEIYKQASAATAAGPGPSGAQTEGEEGDVIDAEYVEGDDKK